MLDTLDASSSYKQNLKRIQEVESGADECHTSSSSETEQSPSSSSQYPRNSKKKMSTFTPGMEKAVHSLMREKQKERGELKRRERRMEEQFERMQEQIGEMQGQLDFICRVMREQRYVDPSASLRVEDNEFSRNHSLRRAQLYVDFGRLESNLQGQIGDLTASTTTPIQGAPPVEVSCLDNSTSRSIQPNDA